MSPAGRTGGWIVLQDSGRPYRWLDGVVRSLLMFCPHELINNWTYLNERTIIASHVWLSVIITDNLLIIFDWQL